MQKCFGVTVKDLKNGIQQAINNGLSEGAMVTWVHLCGEKDTAFEGYLTPPGSILIGIEQLEKGKWLEGTFIVPPAKISEMLN